MKVNDHRGRNKTRDAKLNRAKVYMYFKEKPDKTREEAAADLGLSVVTIRAHVKAINKGWLPPLDLQAEVHTPPESASVESEELTKEIEALSQRKG